MAAGLRAADDDEFVCQPAKVPVLVRLRDAGSVINRSGSCAQLVGPAQLQDEIHGGDRREVEVECVSVRVPEPDEMVLE